MSTPLFRQEAIDHQRERLFGEALIAWPVSLRLLSLVAVLATIAFVAFAALGEYTRKTHVNGYLAPTHGFVKVYAQSVGTITERRVQEGQAVKRGDVLYVLSLDRGSGAGLQAGQVALNEIRRRRDALLQEQSKLAKIGRGQIEQLQSRISDLTDQLAKIDRQIELQRQRRETYVQTTAQYQKLREQGFVSQAQLQQQLGLQLEQEVALQSLEVSKSTVLRDIGAAKQQVPEVALRSQNELSSLERQLSSLDQDLAEVDARREVVVTAPADGVVTTIRGEPGQQANPNIALLSILPAGSVLEAELLAPAAAAGFIQPGKEVRLRYAAFPYQRFGHQRGTVRQVAKTVVAPAELPFPTMSLEPVYVVSVTLDQQTITAYGAPQPLQSGMALEADVLLDRRPLYQWVLEPLFSIQGRI